MIEGPASLRRRIDSSAELQAVVRTMKALAAANIGQYESSIVALADYYRSVELGLGACLRRSGTMSAQAEAHARGGRMIGAVVFGSDQGLVGQFNEIVVSAAVETLAALRGPAQVWAVGERAEARLVDAGITPRGRLAVPNSVQGVAPLVGQVLVEFEALHERAPVTELHLFRNRPTSGSGYAPASQRLLPLDADWLRGLTGVPWPTRNPPEVLGNGGATLRALIREYLFISLFRCCTESLASENASRLAAMERADKNIDELLEHLRGAFHRLRQSRIDEELFDVVSGFEAMSE